MPSMGIVSSETLFAALNIVPSPPIVIIKSIEFNSCYSNFDSEILEKL